MFYFFKYEIKQLISEGSSSYFSSYWNYFDNLLSLFYFLYIPISFQENQAQIKITLQCIIFLLAFIKGAFFLRIYESFSFLVQMLGSVFSDLKHFFLLFGILILGFSVFLSILIQPSSLASYQGVGGALPYILVAFRSAIGDSDMDDYVSEHKTLIWIVWLMIMVVGHVIFMNFIIAVVN
jgi:hypothetical protein